MTGLAKNVVKPTAKAMTPVHHVAAHGQNKTIRRFNETMVTTALHRADTQPTHSK